jgi:hypothetical protein
MPAFIILRLKKNKKALVFTVFKTNPKLKTNEFSHH